jgi:hypothetical protein
MVLKNGLNDNIPPGHAARLTIINQQGTEDMQHRLILPGPQELIVRAGREAELCVM